MEFKMNSIQNQTRNVTMEIFVKATYYIDALCTIIVSQSNNIEPQALTLWQPKNIEVYFSLLCIEVKVKKCWQ